MIDKEAAVVVDVEQAINHYERAERLLITGRTERQVPKQFLESMNNMQDLEPEFAKVINDNFWDLI